MSPTLATAGIIVALATVMPLTGQMQETDRLPEGDSRAGRAAFQALGCNTCHTVAGDPDMKTVVSANPGPQLGAKQAAYGPVRIATSIVAPSHEVSEAHRESHGDNASAMGDYSEAMTVRQLLDVVAFIRSLGDAQ